MQNQKNQKSKYIIIILIIAVIVAIFCINTYSYNVNVLRVTSVLIKQYQLDTSNYTWVTPNYNYSNGVVTIQPVITGVNAITATFNFDAIDIDYINVKFKVKYTGDYNITATNEFNRLYYNSWIYIGELSYNQNNNIITYSYTSNVSLFDVTKLVFQISPSYLNGTIEIYDIDIEIDDYQVMIYNDVNLIKDDIEDIKHDIEGDPNDPIVTGLNDKAEEIENALSDEESMLGELTLEDIDIESAFTPINVILNQNTIAQSWFKTDIWTPLIIYIVTIGLGFALIAFILFGRAT